MPQKCVRLYLTISRSFPIRSWTTLGTDTLITRLTDDVNQVQNGVNMGLRLLLRSPFIVLGSMIMAFTINVRCALIFAVAIPVLFLVVFVIMIFKYPAFRKKYRDVWIPSPVLPEKT